MTVLVNRTIAYLGKRPLAISDRCAHGRAIAAWDEGAGKTTLILR